MTTPEAQRRRQREIIVLLTAALVIMLVAIGVQFVVNGNRIDDLRASQVNACKQSLRPGGVRFIVADQIRRQLAQSSHFDYSKFFPAVPRKELAALLAQSKAQQEREVHALLSINCAAVYR